MAIINAGKPKILKRIANLSGGSYVNQIGISDDATAVAATDIDIGAGPNKLWLTIVPADGLNVSSSTLYASVTVGYSSGNWTINKIGIRDVDNDMWFAKIDTTPTTKTSANAALIEYQLSL